MHPLEFGKRLSWDCDSFSGSVWIVHQMTQIPESLQTDMTFCWFAIQWLTFWIDDQHWPDCLHLSMWRDPGFRTPDLMQVVRDVENHIITHEITKTLSFSESRNSHYSPGESCPKSNIFSESDISRWTWGDYVNGVLQEKGEMESSLFEWHCYPEIASAFGVKCLFRQKSGKRMSGQSVHHHTNGGEIRETDRW